MKEQYNLKLVNKLESLNIQQKYNKCKIEC